MCGRCCVRAERNAQIEDELRSFFRASVEDKIRNGMSPERAQRAAQIEIGSGEMVRHKVWSVGWESGVDSFLRELRVAARQLKRSPGFAITAVLMLAFGIGATTAIFSIVDGVLLRPLPFANPSRLVTLGDQLNGGRMGENGDPGWVTAPEVVTYQRDTRSFQSLGGYTSVSYELSGVGQPAQVDAARMTPSVFSVLGIAPHMGRVFTPREDTQKAQVAVFSYAAWKSRFNANPDEIGTKIDLDREPYTVIGVMPSNFEFPIDAGYRAVGSHEFRRRGTSAPAGANWSYQMVGRLRHGISPGAGADRCAAGGREIMRNYPPDFDHSLQPVVYPLQQITVVQARPLLRTVSGSCRGAVHRLRRTSPDCCWSGPFAPAGNGGAAGAWRARNSHCCDRRFWKAWC